MFHLLLLWYRSAEPQMRVAKALFKPASPLMNRRTSSLNLPFHSPQTSQLGKLPTWYRPPQSQGSATSFTCKADDWLMLKGSCVSLIWTLAGACSLTIYLALYRMCYVCAVAATACRWKCDIQQQVCLTEEVSSYANPHKDYTLCCMTYERQITQSDGFTSSS